MDRIQNEPMKPKMNYLAAQLIAGHSVSSSTWSAGLASFMGAVAVTASSTSTDSRGSNMAFAAAADSFSSASDAGAGAACAAEFGGAAYDEHSDEAEEHHQHDEHDNNDEEHSSSSRASYGSDPTDDHYYTVQVSAMALVALILAVAYMRSRSSRA